MNIYLFCNAGMSTSVLVKKMQEAAAKRNVDANIAAFSVEILQDKMEEADVILVGPQVRHMLPEIKKTVGDKCPVEVIAMRDYGMINGENVLTTALNLLQK
ncbi:PTS sugar transporter subunit IIB [Clostridium felsineum]|uniref:PTS system cellobiose-specific EIIB component n=1 Tax=Clostridium felsineum TaxID=36839 RepID=A0A1S8LAK6_9CLOT|nr:PTS sugar transporter subunit IIB [Clostridium felsineum]MCR3759998.1 PTS sugar transporter subunit IIB [Clostridium felsineum]URZ09074.1 PTS system cellobiose-specific EIIB component [Clostridium felsineum]URZ13761.1 PTS system cellobiose-specific EIIB component [Clostridium felsineum]URZ18717.1 PTS system cellobiose-specific EIIB component [Clostridium felsineum DSM 794]